VYKYKNADTVFLKRIKLLMQENNTSIEELAKITELSVVDCDKVLRGKKCPLEAFVSIALHYRVTCDYLIGFVEDRKAYRIDRKRN